MLLNRGPKTMTSKYNSKCTSCGGRVEIGMEIVYTPGVGAKHSTPGACVVAKQKMLEEMKEREAQQPLLPTSVHPMLDFFKAAQDRGLKSPRLRVLAPAHLRVDPLDEMKLSVTKNGAHPGSLAVVVCGDFKGCVRPDGRLAGKALSEDKLLQDYLVQIAKDPVKAAFEYAKLAGLCSFCGKELTDAGSVEVGYGPLCAKHWGLPHRAKGTPGVQEAV